MCSLVNAGGARKTRPFPSKILYCGALFVSWLAWGGFGTVAAAQEEVPQVIPHETKIPRKKDAGPRALAVLRLSDNGKASLVPIAIMIDGKFWDAGSYKAAPVPMALESGTVYEAERTGSSLGLFTVSTALHSNAANVPTPWIGTGTWVPAGSEKEEKTAKTDSVPAGIATEEGPPRLTKNPAKPAPPPSSPPATTAPSKPRSDDEPPRLNKPAEEPSANSGSAPNAGSSPQGDTKAGSPQPQSKPADTKSGDHPSPPSNTPTSDSGADESSRPRLRRGKPVDSLPDDEIPGYTKQGASSSPAASGAKGATPETPVHLIPAISDAGGPQPHSYGFEFLKDEEGERRQQMTELAKQQLNAYLQARAKARIAPVTTPAKKRETKKAPEPVLSNVQMTAYDLWSTNQPVLILSAQGQVPPQPGQGASEDLQYSILLVAYPDMYNNLHKLYSGVTDKFHLDMTPRLELVDAVDADGDGRGELLFRKDSDAGTGWVIYRATADKLWKMYDSLNPE